MSKGHVSALPGVGWARTHPDAATPSMPPADSAEVPAVSPTYVPTIEETLEKSQELDALLARPLPNAAGAGPMSIAATASSLSDRIAKAMQNVETAVAATEAKFVKRISDVEQRGLDAAARMDKALDAKAKVHEEALNVFEQQVVDLEKATNGGPALDAKNA